MDQRVRLVCEWLRFGMLLLCLFREQPHHVAKPHLKHRDFDLRTAQRRRMMIYRMIWWSAYAAAMGPVAVSGSSCDLSFPSQLGPLVAPTGSDRVVAL